jgi:hypothetical protein
VTTQSWVTGSRPDQATTVVVTTDGPVRLTVTGVASGAAVLVDVVPSAAAGPDGSTTVTLSQGRHRIVIA